MQFIEIEELSIHSSDLLRCVQKLLKFAKFSLRLERYMFKDVKALNYKCVCFYVKIAPLHSPTHARLDVNQDYHSSQGLVHGVH